VISELHVDPKIDVFSHFVSLPKPGLPISPLIESTDLIIGEVSDERSVRLKNDNSGLGYRKTLRFGRILVHGEGPQVMRVEGELVLRS